MRLLTTLVSGLTLVAGALSAKSKGHFSDPFTTFHETAVKAAAPVKLNTALYNELTASSRDYSVSVLLTAMDPRFQCQLCREFQPEWDVLGKSWAQGDAAGKSRHILATLDFNDGREIFQQLGLSTAPVLLHFHATKGSHAKASSDPVRYDFSTAPQTAEVVHGWISRHLPGRPHPAIKRPIDYVSLAVNTILVSGSLTLALVMWPYAIPMIQSRNLWAATSLIAILIFTSGHMFNHIRKVPYVAMTRDGGISYFAGGFQNQLGLETQVIAALYGILSFCSISLAIKAPRIASPTGQRIAVVILSAVILVVYSLLMNIFRIKNGGYPFRLPPFF
ncbi:oligosaccharyl transferase subunit ost3/OST6 [Ceratocystis pirilliformis]|uniref:Oligosaccharyl transferase subunit ost3/OST6 n=1 Tax=Ceratocystis pirilliformis TaxID=259994 RepID=A0ABR3ZNS9_9PEZI